jgi:O-antigen ligase
MACVVVFGPYRNRWICVAAALVLVLFISLSGSRTALGSLTVGIAAIIGSSFFLLRRGLIRLPMQLSRLTIFALCGVATILALTVETGTGGRLSAAALRFIQKNQRAEALSVENILVSRQFMIDLMWQNFQESPYIGIGFEVAKTEYFQEHATLFNAPIEKGFLPMAVLEETGIIGAAFFTLFVVALLTNMVTTLNVPGLALILTFLTVNLGEAMFFSLAGHGAFGWVMMTAGIMLGQRCVVVTRFPRVRAQYAELHTPSTPTVRLPAGA